MSNPKGQRIFSTLERWLEESMARHVHAYKPNLAKATGVLPGKHLPTAGNTGAGYTPAAHALDSATHTGELSDAQHGARSGGTLHALATGTAPGFLPTLSGDTGEVLRGDGSWGAGGSSSSPLTTRGDLYTRDASADARLPIGAAGSYLRSDGTDPSWAAIAWGDITGEPTTLAGYGITDAINSATTRAANSVLAGPASGAAAAPTFRALVRADIPVLAARAATGASQSIPHNVSTVVDFGTVTYDPDGTITTGAAWKFTAPQAGKYAVSVTITHVASANWAAGEFMQYDIYKNNTSSVGGRRHASTGAAIVMDIAGVDVVDLAAGDYIQILAYQNSGGAIVLIPDARFVFVTIWKA